MNLGSLASDNPLIKYTSYGEMKTHIWLKSLIGGDSKAAALLSFQFISIFAGIILIVAVLFLSRKLFENSLESLLFSLGILSGGYMLLFFGYVEYYSLFVLFVSVYTLIGLLIMNGRLNKWLLLPLFILTVLFHIFGLVLLPSLLLVLFRKTKIEYLFEKIPNKTKKVLAFVGALAFVATYIYFYKHSYRFRFALVPALSDRFTVEEYTLFSIKHLSDFLNVLLLLLPGLPIFLVLISKVSLRETIRSKPFQFLIILLFSTLCAVFLIDPKLGMPRDWDLLSFSGIPLATFAYYYLLKNIQSKWNYIAISLMIVLGLLSVIPRAVRQHTPSLAVSEFRTYSGLDQAKNRVGRWLLIDYYVEAGDSSKASIEAVQWLSDYPEHDVVQIVDSLAGAGKPREAMQYAKQMILKNPMFASSYFAVGTEYLVSHNIDSAIFYLEIANGMNPGNYEMLYALGFAYIQRGDISKAERALKNSIKLNEKQIDAYLALLQLYNTPELKEKYYLVLSKAAQKENAPAVILAEFGKYLINKGELEFGYEIVRKAIGKGLDSVEERQLLETYPQLSR